MVKLRRGSILAALTGLLFFLSVVSGTSFAQEQSTDLEKLYKEIAGKYEFEYEGQFMVFVIAIEDGKLMVAPEGDVPDQMTHVEGTEMTFIAYDPNGNEFSFKFVRDEDKTINTCVVTVPSMGIEVTGARIKY